jgi:hypothetical protein
MLHAYNLRQEYTVNSQESLNNALRPFRSATRSFLPSQEPKARDPPSSGCLQEVEYIRKWRGERYEYTIASLAILAFLSVGDDAVGRPVNELGRTQGGKKQS